METEKITMVLRFYEGGPMLAKEAIARKQHKLYKQNLIGQIKSENIRQKESCGSNQRVTETKKKKEKAGRKEIPRRC